MPDLHGIKIKRDRAEIHLKAVEQMVDAYTANPYALSVESDADAGRYIIRSNDRRVLPVDDLAVAIGDCVHNMRSALDYIAWELAGAQATDTSTMFPVFETEDRFKQHGARRIKNVRPDEAQTLIKQFQPYNAGAPSPNLTALWLIEHLDAADKHRLLTVTAPTVGEIFVRPILPEGDYGDETVGVALEIPPLNSAPEFGAVIALVTVTPPTPDMKVEPTYAPQVVFRDDGQMPPVVSVVANLRVMLRSVDKVVAEFTPFFV